VVETSTVALSGPTADVCIEFTSVDKWFGTVQVLHDINFNVRLNEEVVVCDPSGLGKSTMICCISVSGSRQRSSYSGPQAEG
jgi:ABC-type polar amino acid transport system ATPase subunit